MSSKNKGAKKSGRPDKDGKRPAFSISNKRAFHDYHVMESYKAGIVLTGTEIKSIRNGKVLINQSFARVEKGEMFLYGLHISPYEQGTHYNHEPERKRKLLLKKSEIQKLASKTQEKGLTIIPLKLYFDRCWVKIDIGLCKGKQLYDKRVALQNKDVKRQIDRAVKSTNR